MDVIPNQIQSCMIMKSSEGQLIYERGVRDDPTAVAVQMVETIF